MSFYLLFNFLGWAKIFHIFKLYISAELFLHHSFRFLVNIKLFLYHICWSLVIIKLTLYYIFGLLIYLELILHYVLGLLISIELILSTIAFEYLWHIGLHEIDLRYKFSLLFLVFRPIWDRYCSLVFFNIVSTLTYVK